VVAGRTRLTDALSGGGPARAHPARDSALREGAGHPDVQEDVRYHPIGAWCDSSEEFLAASLRPGNAGSNATADPVDVLARRKELKELRQAPPAPGGAGPRSTDGL
jgi:hypothetical protein